MGLEIVVARGRPCRLDAVLGRLAAIGLPSTVAMVDNVLQGPGAVPPLDWRDARLKTPAGIVALRRTTAGVAIVVFGNAGPDLLAAQRLVGDAVRETP